MGPHLPPEFSVRHNKERRTRRETRQPPFLSVVVPCYNEQENLSELYRRVTGVCDQLLRPYEIVLVNDGSVDGTWPLMLALARSDMRVVAVNLSRNFGQQAALTAGLTIAGGDRILILDGDLQDPPELLPEMLAMMGDGADVVFGQRRKYEGGSVARRAARAAFYGLLERCATISIPRNTGDFRLMSRRALDAVLRMPEQHRFVRGMISWVGFPQRAIQFDRGPRFAGETKWSAAQLLSLAFDALVSFSVRPLAIAVWLSTAVGAMGCVTLAAFCAGWILSGSPSTLLGVVAAVLLASSVQLLYLGVIGAYLGRLYEQSRGRPLFIIQEILGGTRSEEPCVDDHCTPS